ncbi:MAG: MMPL family transporter [Kocuria sp.]|nr:MMPL family transporter [Kocuria sp.]
MAKFLYRLGFWAAKRGRAVLASWAAVLAISVGAFLAFSGNLATQFEIPGTETQRLADQLSDELPEANEGMGLVVFTTDSDSGFTDTQRDDITAALKDTADLSGVSSVADPFVEQKELESEQKKLSESKGQIDSLVELRDSGDLEKAIESGAVPKDMTEEKVTASEKQLDLGERSLQLVEGYGFVSDDKTTAVATIKFHAAQTELEPDDQQAVMSTISNADIDGVSVDYSTELAQSLEIFGPTEVVGLFVAAVVLFMMLRTVIGAALPVISALMGVAVAATAALSLSGAVQMASVTPVLGIMLGLAVGIDYSLFLLNKHRRQLRQGIPLHESIGLATGTAGSAVVFAGCTVIVALVALTITGIPFLALMGGVAAFSVLVAVLMTITFTPALLGMVGIKILPKKQRDQVEADDTEDHVSAVKSPLSVRRPLVTLVVAVVGLILLAIPVAGMRLGLPDGSSEPVNSTQYRAYQAMEQNFGAGRNGPMTVVVDHPDDLSTEEASELQVEVGERVAELDDVRNVIPGPLEDDSTLAVLQVIPESGPADEKTEALVGEIRKLSPEFQTARGAPVGVAGQTAANIDISRVLAEALPIYVAVVMAISLAILVLVFRSLVVPVIASIGFLLSLLGGLGAIVAVYQWGWLGELFGVSDPGPVMSFLPTLMVGILFGLAMDYQLFIATGMREAYVHGYPARQAVTRGLIAGRPVVTAAAVIMIAVFAGFIFSHLSMIRPMGFGLAVGVLLDAFVVRMQIMPALMTLLGDKAWWLPAWLDHLLPDADVEGASLQQENSTPAQLPWAQPSLPWGSSSSLPWER